MNKKTFHVKQYRLRSEKLHHPLRAVQLADMHCETYGEEIHMLFDQCADLKPDLILSSGDMVTGRAAASFEGILQFFSDLSALAPIYFVNGNHETKLRKFPYTYRYYVSELRRRGIFLLNNKTERITLGKDRICISGAELPLRVYEKLKMPYFSAGELEDRIGPPVGGEKDYHILLAHNPAFAELYVDWGADLSLCGHYHGGIMRLKGNQVALSPYGFPLPKYGYGAFQREGRAVIVSSGLGDHEVPLRINNPKELVVVDIYPRN